MTGGAQQFHRPARGRGFTLLEVMIALAVLGIAMMALLALDHQDLQGVIRARELTQASMLAQTMMTQAELERFPDLGQSSGTFDKQFPGQYANFRWQRMVTESGIFPDLRKVTIVVQFGPNFGRRFELSELLHNPLPPESGTLPPAGGQPIPPATP
ncbi:MAG TPA: type II secretion system minor pseudopilin GspI [Candidatus Binataceae bacterium]|nr:type II secretion system minor pseudopilin GspI [Candidatus Binataceae bacterium]